MCCTLLYIYTKKTFPAWRVTDSKAKISRFRVVINWVFFSGRCSVTIFLTDLDGTVTQHDGNFLAVDGKSNLDGIFTAVTQHDGELLAVDGKSNFDGIFMAVTQHDGKLRAADGFRFLGAASKWLYGKHISST